MQVIWEVKKNHEKKKQDDPVIRNKNQLSYVSYQWVRQNHRDSDKLIHIKNIQLNWRKSMSLDTLDLWVDCKMKMDISKTKIESKEFIPVLKIYFLTHIHKNTSWIELKEELIYLKHQDHNQKENHQELQQHR